MVDQFGNKVAPASQGNLVLDTWNFVLIDISSACGETLTDLSIGWQHNGSSGGYRGYLDDIVIDYDPPRRRPQALQHPGRSSKFSQVGSTL